MSKSSEAIAAITSATEKLLGGSGAGKNNATGGGSLVNAKNMPDVIWANRRDITGYQDPKANEVFTAQQGVVDATYDNPRKQGVTDWQKQAQRSVQDDFTEQEKSRLYGGYTNNFSINDPRGNINERSPHNTLVLSRLADRLNNHRWWNPGTVGYFNFSARNGIQEVGKQIGTSERWEPIETEEMRMMRNNEALDKNRRQLAQQLQADLDRYPLSLRTQGDTVRSNLASQIGISENELNRFMQRDLFTGTWTKPNEQQILQKIEEFRTYLQMESKTKLGQYLVHAFDKCGPVIASYISRVLSGSPGMSLTEFATSQTMMDVYQEAQRYGLNPAEAALTFNRLMNEWIAGSTGEGAMSAAKAGAKGILRGAKKE